MIEYLKNLLPRIIKFSESLDHTELFVDHPWIFIEQDGSKHTYIFERTGILIMSRNGVGSEGKWRYLAAAKSLWIDRNIDKIMLNQHFIDPGVMILRKDGNEEDPFILINQTIIPDLDLKRYLETKYKDPKPGVLPNTPNTDLHLEDGNILTLSKKFTPDAPSTLYDAKILKSLYPINDGHYKLAGFELYIIIKNQRIDYFYRRIIKVKTNKGTLIIYNRYKDNFVEDICQLNNNQNPTERLRTEGYPKLAIVYVKNGIITNYFNDVEIMLLVLGIVAVVIIVIIILNVS